MEPETETHHGVEIRYGYSVQDDQFHAHFDLPRKDMNVHFQNTVGIYRLPALSEGRQHMSAHKEVDVLKQARAAIDRYFED